MFFSFFQFNFDIEKKEIVEVVDNNLKLSCPKNLYSLASELSVGYFQDKGKKMNLYPSWNRLAFEKLEAGQADIILTFLPLKAFSAIENDENIMKNYVERNCAEAIYPESIEPCWIDVIWYYAFQVV